MTLFDLEDTTAVVTGAGSGIGRAIAIGLAQHGAAVVVGDIDSRAAERTAGEIRQQRGRATSVLADVRTEAGVDALIAATLADYGSIDVMVNNVGGNAGNGEPTESLALADWTATFDLTINTTFLGCRAVWEPMVAAGGGAIINIASLYGLVGHDYRLYDLRPDGRPHEELAYAAAKGGVISLTRALALYWARYDIRVNAIAPGHVRTDTVAEQVSSETWDRLSATVPLRRVAQPDDIAGASVFLASRASSFVTGQVLTVDGGWLVR